MWVFSYPSPTAGEAGTRAEGHADGSGPAPHPSVPGRRRRDKGREPEPGAAGRAELGASTALWEARRTGRKGRTEQTGRRQALRGAEGLPRRTTPFARVTCPEPQTRPAPGGLEGWGRRRMGLTPSLQPLLGDVTESQPITTPEGLRSMTLGS